MYESPHSRHCICRHCFRGIPRFRRAGKRAGNRPRASASCAMEQAWHCRRRTSSPWGRQLSPRAATPAAGFRSVATRRLRPARHAARLSVHVSRAGARGEQHAARTDITLTRQNESPFAPPTDAHSHTDLAWRLRHLPRSVLRDDRRYLRRRRPDDRTTPGPPGSNRWAFFDQEFTGQVNFLTTASTNPLSAPHEVATAARRRVLRARRARRRHRGLADARGHRLR